MAAGAPVGNRDLFVFNRALCSAAISEDFRTAAALALSRHYSGTGVVRAICRSQARSLVRILCPRRVALSRFVRRERQKLGSPCRNDDGICAGLGNNGRVSPIFGTESNREHCRRYDRWLRGTLWNFLDVPAPQMSERPKLCRSAREEASLRTKKLDNHRVTIHDALDGDFA